VSLVKLAGFQGGGRCQRRSKEKSGASVVGCHGRLWWDGFKEDGAM
jgi:hypothetical protein